MSKVNFNGVEFSVMQSGEESFMLLSELLAFFKFPNKNKFMEGIAFYCTPDNTLCTLVNGKEDTALRVDLVLRRALSGKTAKMCALANWIFGVFRLQQKSK